MFILRRVAALVAVLFLVAGLPVPAHAAAYVAISGAGSTWSFNALDQWRTNVRQYGMTISYAPTGSSDGRSQFRNGTVDFAVSEIPYGLADRNVQDPPPARQYAYMPIVAGGTAFMYNLKIGTKRVTNLRLSGDVVVKIFTGKITKWDDPAIAADNPNLTLPAKKIVPVVRSDGSGTTAQFTKWMSSEYGSLWNDYCGQVGRSVPCGLTSYYPLPTPQGAFVASSGSIGVASYVKQAQSEGAITYVEYSYAVESRFPVVKLRNKSDYFIEPTARNVAVGLLGATIDSTDLTQRLEGVYRSNDARAYPLSSYSYMIVPRAVEGSFNTAKGQTLRDFAYYFLCEGQRNVSVIGYSPLPKNLVQAGLTQVARIPGTSTKTIDISKCNNPTFSSDGTNVLARDTPQPAACDKVGSSQCATGTGGTVPQQPVPTGTANPTASTAPTGTASPVPGTTTGAPQIDPDTGLPVGGDNGGGDGEVLGVPVALPAETGWDETNTLMLVAVFLLLGIILGPPLIGRALANRNNTDRRF
ncbi:phosphate transport system substrate-binding protein [Allocatelliglobosispora scoriae]|uniref:Phosphate transport system substrate-binding protein n=1 Tax=Allocatelliglobosispora scoriae TaxID=643052 RepID=A0A841BRB7_9ACTN|nr:phosphate ABC transporter substrate-binding protein PstS [Allocatelliglobosispora scoriae]MBB5869916.1 phosphate transport system substrate-binding protein [Allocatelliglobosispora scoriae]